MRVIICCPIPELANQIAMDCELAGFWVTAEPSLQEFGSLLYREPDAIGVFWAPGPASASETCDRFRIAEIKNSLLVLVDEKITDRQELSKARGRVLRSGADDVQPSSIEIIELIARLRALHRRLRLDGSPIVDLAGCTYFPQRSVISGTATIHLTKLESRLLTALAERKGMILTKAACMDAMYGGRDEAAVKIIDVYICKLRRKIHSVGGGDCIETMWGQGYTLTINARGSAPL